MRRSNIWILIAALALGVGAAAATAQGNGPLPPKALAILCVECGAEYSSDGVNWTPLTGDCAPRGLWLVCPEWVRGPARILVESGTIVVVPQGSVVRASWDPSTRAYRFEAWCGNSTIAFTNGCYPVCEGRVVSLLTPHDTTTGRGDSRKVKRFTISRPQINDQAGVYGLVEAGG